MFDTIESVIGSISSIITRDVTLGDRSRPFVGLWVQVFDGIEEYFAIKSSDG